MNFEIIEDVKKMLGLTAHDESLVDQYIITLKDKTASEQERSVARSLLLNILGNAFLSNSKVNEYVVQDEIQEMKDKINSFKNSNLDEAALIDAINDMEFYLSSSIKEDFERSVLPALEELRKKIGIHKEDLGIRSSLHYIMDSLKLKASQNAVFRHKMDKSVSKKPGENAQKRLDSFENNVLKMIERVENFDATDMEATEALKNDLLNLIGKLAGLNRIIDAKRENEPIVYKSTTTEIQKYNSNGFSIQRSSKGPIDNPTTEEPFKLPSSIKYFLAGVGAVAVIAVMIVLATKGSTHEGPTATSTPNPSDNNFDTVAQEILDNWKGAGVDTTKEDVEEILKAFGNENSNYTINQSDMVLFDSLNIVLANALNGIETNSLDLSSLIAEGVTGKAGIDKMQKCLDGCIEDSENKLSYVTEALKIQARIFGENETVDGISFAEDSATDPRVKIVWARLAMGVNMFVGTIDQDIVVEVNGNTYLADDLIDNVELTNYIKDAKTQITGEVEKSMNLN